MIALTQQTTIVSNKMISGLREIGIFGALGLAIVNMRSEWIEENQGLLVILMGGLTLGVVVVTADQYYQLPSNSNPKRH